MRTNREVLRAHNFTDEAEDSFRRAIQRKLKQRKGRLQLNELALLADIVGHELLKYASK